MKEPQQAPKSTFSQDFKWESSIENLWADELDDLEPSQNSKPHNSKLLQNTLTQNMPKIPLFDDDDETEEKLEIKNLVEELKIDDVVLAKISDVNNPFKFWIHLTQDTYELQFNTLNKEMQ